MEEAGAGDMVVDRFHCWLTRVHGVRWETNDPRPPSDHQSHPDHPALRCSTSSSSSSTNKIMPNLMMAWNSSTAYSNGGNILPSTKKNATGVQGGTTCTNALTPFWGQMEFVRTERSARLCSIGVRLSSLGVRTDRIFGHHKIEKHWSLKQKNN